MSASGWDALGGRAPRTVVVEAARALARRAETGRAWAILAGAEDPEALALRAELARRRGDLEGADALAARAGASAVRGRAAWDAGDLEGAERHVDGAHFVRWVPVPSLDDDVVPERRLRVELVDEAPLVGAQRARERELPVGERDVAAARRDEIEIGAVEEAELVGAPHDVRGRCVQLDARADRARSRRHVDRLLGHHAAPLTGLLLSARVHH